MFTVIFIYQYLSKIGRSYWLESKAVTYVKPTAVEFSFIDTWTRGLLVLLAKKLFFAKIQIDRNFRHHVRFDLYNCALPYQKVASMKCVGD